MLDCRKPKRDGNLCRTLDPVGKSEGPRIKNPGTVPRGDIPGQGANTRETVQKFRGDMKEQVEGVKALTQNPLLLGYVAALHENMAVRSFATTLLDDAKVLCIVARSSNHQDSVFEAFRKLNGRLAELDPIDRHFVAMCAPSGELRAEALSLLRNNFSTMVLDSRGRDYHNLVSGMDLSDACGIHELIMDVVGLEKSIRSGVPITEEQINGRRGGFDPDNLMVLLSRG